MPAASIIRQRQLRGLIRHALGINIKQRRDAAKTPPRRDLARAACLPMPQRIKGAALCLWCARPCFAHEHGWHSYCKSAYIIARGRQHDSNGAPLIGAPAACSQCGITPGEAFRFEIDHITPLRLARLRGWRAFVKAHDIKNFVWLCNSCHELKTQHERQIYRNRQSPLA